MRLLHTSDWHLGRQFHNVSLLEDQAHVLDQLVDIVKDQNVDVVLIAGDIFDRSVPPASAIMLFDDFLNRICGDLKIPIILIAGNHDSPERINFASGHLIKSAIYIRGLITPDLTPVVLEDQHGKVCFFPIPYVDPSTIRTIFNNEVSDFDQAYAFITKEITGLFNGNQRNVALAHLFLDGGESSESERPLSLGGIDKVSPQHFLPFHYTALGHLHGPQYKYRETIRYSGSILKYSFSEEHHNKSVTIVDMDKDGQCLVKQIKLSPKRDLRVIEGSLQELLIRGETDAGKDDYLLVRLTDTHAILDIMNKLREVYPNVLHLERPGLMAATERQQISRDHLKRGELTMFRDFFEQVTGESLTKEQSTLVEQTLEKIHRGEEI